MSSGVVELVGLTKRFEGSTAVNGLDLRVEAGEFFSLLGPSGCGKSTTLRMIAGFERPTEGRILLDGVDVAQTPPHVRNVNTVFQSYALFPHLDVARNIAFGLKRSKVPKDEIAERVSRALELVQLPDRARAKPGELSGGQQQRIALARALVNEPAVLLLDEPLGALDLKLRRHMQVELKEIQRKVGITFIYVTHDQEEALTMSDRIAVMNAGVIEQCGPPEEVYERPRKTFVAGFIGVSNLLEGVVEEGHVRLGTGALVPAELPDDCAAGDRVHLSVRPEKIWLDDFQDGMVLLTGTLRETVYLGTTTQYVVELGPGAQLVALEQNLDRAYADDRWAQGDRVQLGWKPGHSIVLR